MQRTSAIATAGIFAVHTAGAKLFRSYGNRLVVDDGAFACGHNGNVDFEKNWTADPLTNKQKKCEERKKIF